ncbi:hypothetical protein [Sphingomonas koreensis]|uniref:hypothetical protein n=1 Tax=Sphingomonas koreensis TaxID=93064 RepID=UPI000AC1A7A7|nr:hypothetical protein [Sphingomonas koreensis]PJI88459.1 hypothetical protein BDW16_1733 [Sphingomonas koreensis]
MIDPPSTTANVPGARPSRSEQQREPDVVAFEQWLAPSAGSPQLPAVPDGSPLPENAYAIPGDAKVFNEDGFFGAVQTAYDREPEIGGPVPTAVAQGGGLDDPAARFSVFESDGSVRRGGGILPVDASAPVTRKAAPAAPAGPRIRNAGEPEQAIASSVEPQVEPPEIAEAEIAPPEQPYGAPVRVARALSALHVAIRDVERGLQVIVAVDAMSREDRERLADQISALLSRHGLTPRDVQIAGTVSFRSAGKK